MQEDFGFDSGISGALLPDRASQARAALVHDRIQQSSTAHPSSS